MQPGQLAIWGMAKTRRPVEQAATAVLAELDTKGPLLLFVILLRFRLSLVQQAEQVAMGGLVVKVEAQLKA